jgi:hypothetical protein
MTFKALKFTLGLLLVFQFAPQFVAQQNSIFVKFDSFTCQGARNPEVLNNSAVSSVALGGARPAAVTAGGIQPGATSFDDTKIVKTLDD